MRKKKDFKEQAEFIVEQIFQDCIPERISVGRGESVQLKESHIKYKRMASIIQTALFENYEHYVN